MTEYAHVETTPQPEQAADLAGLESIAAELGGPELPGAELEAEQAGPSIPTADLIAPLVTLFCASVAPAWAITSAEQSQLCESYAAVVDKYFPDGVPMGPEVGAVLVTAAVVMPRLGQPLKPEPKKEPEGGDRENQ